ncbi:MULTISPECIES: NAD-dependent epimerase/dehydratase family protein [unclassified Streptomyces]|uniref:NAD-dependent epimerase/dehydratase family protein n=1 Tax=unclassified Streptomyces TaxID=2593676 RepID=UPI002E13573F|nr:NAD-dependent epimerase/dehydratase family protein [Streptomyces sp. NBC_01197]WSS49840.1 NAD-dependent epimerase/dehydratase family protein [Streptomyces sp. NBC_01180]
MKLLVIGGSVFLGRAFVREALRRGWEVTTFNRGKTHADLEGVQVVRGDREHEEDLARLVEAGPWDAIVDVCGYVPRVVGASVAALAESAPTYLFISSINARPGWPAEPVDESSSRHDGNPDAGPDDGDYGKLKAGCEMVVEQRFPGRTLILEPGLIIGPHDRARRLTWWLRRAAQGGRMVAPGAPDREMQLIDVRDIAIFGLDRIEAEDSGMYMVSGTAANATWGEFLGACSAATGDKAELVWVDEEILTGHEITVWTELPLWAPLEGETAAVWKPSSAKAIAAGLHCRPVNESIHSTAAWLFGPGGLDEAFGEDRTGREAKGITPEREQTLLAAADARAD